jgi:predicted nuclease of restriction endonuclease-like (RecB) superfamily
VQAKDKVWQQINKTLINLYWSIGEYIYVKMLDGKWGKSTVENLSSYLLSQDSSSKGFSARNLWRMKQFYETYKDHSKLSALLTEISWTNNLHILSKTRSIEEKEFYINLCIANRYSERTLAKLIDSGTYERTAIADLNMPAVLTEFPVNAKGIFKDSYLFDFTKLAEGHKEVDLRKALIKHLKDFLLELGRDFSLIGEEYIVQVGLKDYKIDLLMFHRGLNAMVAIELKVTEFQPEYVGKLQFYLEALDQDVKKPHENPSIGILLCKTKDDEVVKYAMNRNISPAIVAEYETKLINKSLLQQKLHDLAIDLSR